VDHPAVAWDRTVTKAIRIYDKSCLTKLTGLVRFTFSTGVNYTICQQLIKDSEMTDPPGVPRLGGVLAV
jgi:hypothetical protein